MLHDVYTLAYRLSIHPTLPPAPLFPYTTLFRSCAADDQTCQAVPSFQERAVHQLAVGLVEKVERQKQRTAAGLAFRSAQACRELLVARTSLCVADHELGV